MGRFNEHRQNYFVDPRVQGAILRQAAYYWLCGSVVFTLVMFLFRIVPPWLVSGDVDFGKIWHHLAPMVVSSAVLLPIVMFSAVRFTHRFVGPMIRFRQVLRQLAQGETVPPVKLRRKDFWQDVANELNQVSDRLREVSAREPKCEETVSKY